MFCLTISLWVVARGKVEMNVKRLSEQAEEVGYKFRSAVGSDMRRDSMLREYMQQE